MTTQTAKPKIITKCTMVKQAMKELLVYRQTPTADNTRIIHRMKHIEKLCVIHGLSETEIKRLCDEVFGQVNGGNY